MPAPLPPRIPSRIETPLTSARSGTGRHRARLAVGASHTLRVEDHHEEAPAQDVPGGCAGEPIVAVRVPPSWPVRRRGRSVDQSQQQSDDSGGSAADPDRSAEFAVPHYVSGTDAPDG